MGELGGCVTSALCRSRTGSFADHWSLLLGTQETFGWCHVLRFIIQELCKETSVQVATQGQRELG